MKNRTAKTPRSNRLVGWLVSYQNDERGIYHEIRAGRFFIGQGRIDGERSIPLNGEQIGKVHAALHAASNREVKLQDIFSDGGTYVTRSGSREEFAVEGHASLEHGDWIRFGDNVRFQVCLINGGNSK